MFTVEFWSHITRFGQAEVLLPLAFALVVIVMATARSVWAWALPFALAVLLTLATKIAFIGWGLGLASLDFTGLSGHAVLAAAIYPWLAAVLSKSYAPKVSGFAIGLGFLLAILVTCSRVVIHAHSVSEALAGFLLGVCVSSTGIYLLHDKLRRVPSVYALAVVAWILILPMQIPRSSSHEIVTRMALLLSQHTRPYQRADLLRQGDS